MFEHHSQLPERGTGPSPRQVAGNDAVLDAATSTPARTLWSTSRQRDGKAGTGQGTSSYEAGGLYDAGPSWV